MTVTRLRRSALVAMALAVLSAWGAAMDAAAADKSDREREAMRRMQAALKKVEQEKATLAQEKAALEQDKAKAETQAKSLGDKVGGLQASVARAKKAEDELNRKLETQSKDKAGLAASLEATRRQLDSETKAREQTQDTLRSREQELERVRADLEQGVQRAAVCEEKNVKLYGVGMEVLSRYDSKGCWDAVLQAEPFTQLKRVEMENLVEDYRDKLDAQRVAPEKK